MTRKVILPAVLFIFFLWTVVIFFGACAKKDQARPVYEGPMRIGKPFPHFQSAPPATDEERAYLGIEEGPFSLSDVESKMVVIEFFNVYCVSCQLQAPLLQDYFEEIEKDRELGGKLKVLAFGAGNTQKEVDRFRDDNNLGFPMVPDPDYEIYAKLGAPERTPFLVFVKRFEEPEPMEMVTNFHRGVIRDEGVFFSMVRENLAMTVDEVRAKTERAGVPMSLILTFTEASYHLPASMEAVPRQQPNPLISPLAPRERACLPLGSSTTPWSRAR